ncbi:MAG: pyridoxal 5'-phosphate synthase glutaminase subunit PdxT [bacterium]|nr:pyridoxal 5'-phosphate synthase glutaminase subunit PdxT [bacterium]
MSVKENNKSIYSELTVGLLAFQGDFDAHQKAIESLGAATLEVRTDEDLAESTHLIIPGGESTTFLKLLEFHDLTETIRRHVGAGKPVLLTCAGVILFASEVINPAQESMGLLDVTVERNAYGSQVDSFTADLDIPCLGGEKFPGVFIRAPRIAKVGKSVEVLSEFDGNPVLVRQRNILGMTFHPELSGDTRIHEMFLKT